MIQLDEEVETKQSKILDLQQQLAAAKQENEGYLKLMNSFEITKAEPVEFGIKAEFVERESLVSDENASEHSSNEGFYDEDLQKTISPCRIEACDRTPTQNERDYNTEPSDAECANSLKSENIHSPKTPISENEDDMRTRGDFTNKLRENDLNDVDIDFDISDTWDRTSSQSVSDIHKNDNDVGNMILLHHKIETQNTSNVQHGDVKSDQNTSCNVEATVPKIQSVNASDDDDDDDNVHARTTALLSDADVNMKTLTQSENILHRDIPHNPEMTVRKDANQDAVDDDDTVIASNREFETENVQIASCRNFVISRTASDNESETDDGIHPSVNKEKKNASAIEANELSLDNPPSGDKIAIKAVTECEYENVTDDDDNGIVEATVYDGDVINLSEASSEYAQDCVGDDAIVNTTINATLPENELYSKIVSKKNFASKTKMNKIYGTIDDNVIETDSVDLDLCENDMGSHIALNQIHVNVEESNNGCLGESASVTNATEVHVRTELNSDTVCLKTGSGPQSPISEPPNVTHNNTSLSKSIVTQFDKPMPDADEITPLPGFQSRRDSDWSSDSDENDKNRQPQSSNNCSSPNKRTSSNLTGEVPIKKPCITPDVNHGIGIPSQNGFDESTPNSN